MYPHTQDGLVHCYVAALPFLQNTVTGDIVWSAALFGTWWLARLAISPSQVNPNAPQISPAGKLVIRQAASQCGR